MAASDSINQHATDLESALHDATNLAACLQEATALFDGPPWVYLLTRTIHQLDAAASQLIEDVNQKCIPLMRDMETVNRR